MADLVSTVRVFRSRDSDPCEAGRGRYRRESGDCRTDNGGGSVYVADRLCGTSARQLSDSVGKNVAVPGAFGVRNRFVMAVLLSRASSWSGFPRRTRR